jgi:hypothetical protein
VWFDATGKNVLAGSVYGRLEFIENCISSSNQHNFLTLNPNIKLANSAGGDDRSAMYYQI